MPWLLAACTGGVGVGFGISGGSGGVRLGTGVSFPLGARPPTPSGINVVNEQIVSYFADASQQFAASDRPIKGGFYRKLLGKQGRQLWLVQDFYYDNDRKYNDALLLSPRDAYRFGALPASGTFYNYHANGQLASKRQLESGRLISVERWDSNGVAIR